jgi:hypothetical protein
MLIFFFLVHFPPAWDKGQNCMGKWTRKKNKNSTVQGASHKKKIYRGKSKTCLYYKDKDLFTLFLMILILTVVLKKMYITYSWHMISNALESEQYVTKNLLYLHLNPNSALDLSQNVCPILCFI